MSLFLNKSARFAKSSKPQNEQSQKLSHQQDDAAKNQSKRPLILFTGGGTGGHVYPNVALVPEFEKRGFDVAYIGGEESAIERKIARDNGIKYYAIPTVKLVRGASLQALKNNLQIPSKLKKSVQKASEILAKIRPDCVFSKGGFVSLPVVLAAKKANIPTFAHESDLTLGVANKIAKATGATILKANPNSQFDGIFVGMPLRKNLVYKDKNAACNRLEINNPFKKPILLVLGGSSGASAINEAVKINLERLTSKYFVLHVTGKNKSDKTCDCGDSTHEKRNNRNPNCKTNDVRRQNCSDSGGCQYGENRNNKRNGSYLQFEYADDIALFYTVCDVVLSRAGATSVFEISSLGKKAVFVPLPKGASRGDQIFNAELAKDFGATIVKQDSSFCDNLPKAIDKAMQNPPMKEICADANGKIADMVCDRLRRGEKCTDKKPSPNGSP